MATHKILILRIDKDSKSRIIGYGLTTSFNAGERDTDAYEKGPHFCLVSVAIDSSCDDEEDGHVPSEYWFSVSCGEGSSHRTEERQ